MSLEYYKKQMVDLRARLAKEKEAKKLFDKAVGLTVQIKDPKGEHCVDNKLTIGQAARGEKH